MLVNIDAEKLKKLRESRCWSQQQLADLAGLSLRTVQRVEAKSVASQESVKCLAATFDVPAHSLIKDSAIDTSMDNKDSEIPETDNAPVQVTDSKETAAADTGYKRELHILYIGFAIVFVSHLFGFWGIFSAFDEGRISEDTFQFLKNALSIVLIVTAVILFFKDKQLKKKHSVGSSF